MATFAAQQIGAREIVISPNKQNAYGTVLGDVSLVHNLRFDGGAFADLAKEYMTDMDLAKGHPWATFKNPIRQNMRLSLGGLQVYDFLAGWLAAFLFGKVQTSGVGPYTHLFTADLSTTIAPVTTAWIHDTADVKSKVPDLAINSLRFNGAAIGPVTADAELVGSGRFTDIAMAAPALAVPTYLLNSDADILLGPQGAPVSIKERVRSWSVSLTANLEDYRHPGSGLYAGFTRRGDLRITVQLGIAAKDVDDIRTLGVLDTKRELQINVNSGAAAQLKFKFPAVILRVTGGAEGTFVLWTIEADDTGVLKDGVNEPIEVTAINGQATYLVGA